MGSKVALMLKAGGVSGLVKGVGAVAAAGEELYPLLQRTRVLPADVTVCSLHAAGGTAAAVATVSSDQPKQPAQRQLPPPPPSHTNR